MKRSFVRILCGAALSAMACVASAQNSPPQPAPKPVPFAAPQKAPSPESPQTTTNAKAQAEADYHAALAKCDAKPRTEQQRCVSQAEERFYAAFAGANPGEQGNPGSNTGARGTGG
jgi:hypothetical protein